MHSSCGMQIIGSQFWYPGGCFASSPEGLVANCPHSISRTNGYKYFVCIFRTQNMILLRTPVRFPRRSSILFRLPTSSLILLPWMALRAGKHLTYLIRPARTYLQVQANVFYTCRIQNPDTQRAGRVGAAHGGAAGRGGAGCDGTSTGRPAQETTDPRAFQEIKDNSPEQLFASMNKGNPM